MKAVILLLGIGILALGTAGCDWDEHHEHHGGAYEGDDGYGHGEYRGYPDSRGYPDHDGYHPGY